MTMAIDMRSLFDPAPAARDYDIEIENASIHQSIKVGEGWHLQAWIKK